MDYRVRDDDPASLEIAVRRPELSQRFQTRARVMKRSGSENRRMLRGDSLEAARDAIQIFRAGASEFAPVERGSCCLSASRVRAGRSQRSIRNSNVSSVKSCLIMPKYIRA